MSRSDNIQPVDTGGVSFSELNDPVLTVDVTGETPVVTSVNNAFTEVFGYSNEELTGLNPFEYIDGPCTDVCMYTVTAVVSSGDVFSDAVTVLTGAEEQEFLFRAVPVGADNSRAYFVFLDVTRYTDREAVLRDEISELQEYTSSLTHDLRNAIAVAKAEVAKFEYKTDRTEDGDVIVPAELHESVMGEVRDAHNRLEALIDDEIADPTEDIDGGGFCESWCDVESVVDECWSLVATGESSVDVIDAFEIECNEDRVLRVFENLFRNAVEHNDDAVSVRVGEHEQMATTTRGGSGVGDAFFVDDDGSGIPEEMIESVFECGETTGGTGRGLAIVAEVANQHGWEVSVRNKATGGVRFVFEDVSMRTK